MLLSWSLPTIQSMNQGPFLLCTVCGHNPGAPSPHHFRCLRIVLDSIKVVLFLEQSSSVLCVVSFSDEFEGPFFSSGQSVNTLVGGGAPFCEKSQARGHDLK